MTATPTFDRIHLIGIGGSGMSPIAELLHAQGVRVSGSDTTESATTRRLAALGIDVRIGHDAAHVAGALGVVASSAIPASNPELRAARTSGVPVLARAAMLAQLMIGKRGIAVAGTHGKTTTTSLVASGLLEAGADPSWIVGGELIGADGQPLSGARSGGGEAMVVEADESDASFLQLTPQVAVVTNIDADHMDTYGHDTGRLRDAFVRFLHRLPRDGRAVVCGDDAGVAAIAARIDRPTTTYGLGEGADLRAIDVAPLRAQGGRDGEFRDGAQDDRIGMRFVARQSGRPDLPLTLALAGEHNVRNALAALAVARELGLADDATARALARFAGVGRRFQRHGEWAARDGGRFLLVDDYGHHPAEIAAVLAAARGAWPGRRLVLAFQPHRYTRTRDCMADFAAVLQRADAALVCAVYPAGEKPIAGADGAALAARVPGAVYVGDVGALPAAIVAAARGGDVVITMGAGSIAAVPARMAEEAQR